MRDPVLVYGIVVIFALAIMVILLMVDLVVAEYAVWWHRPSRPGK